MGCDIHAWAEYRDDDGWHRVGDVFPLDDWAKDYYKKDLGNEFYEIRSYGVFGFLAGVRNYSAVPMIAEPRGLPSDLSPEVAKEWEEWQYDGHSASWLSREELLAYDYDASIEDRRVTREVAPGLLDGGATAEPGGGSQTTLREFLDPHFFSHLEALAKIKAPQVRVVFWFDN